MNPELQNYLAKLTKGVLDDTQSGWNCPLCQENFKKRHESIEMLKRPENKENEENRISSKFYFQFASKSICTCCYTGINPQNWIDDEAKRSQKIFPMLRKAHDMELKKGSKGYPIKDDTILGLLNEMCPPQSPQKSKENLSSTGTSSTSKAKDVEPTTSKTTNVVLSPRITDLLSKSMQEDDDREIFTLSSKATPRNITFSEDSLTSKKRAERERTERNAFGICSSAVSLNGISLFFFCSVLLLTEFSKGNFSDATNPNVSEGHTVKLRFLETFTHVLLRGIQFEELEKIVARLIYDCTFVILCRMTTLLNTLVG
jgi:hypothetical protein